MIEILECKYCGQKNNIEKLADEPLWACAACGAPLPEYVKPYSPSDYSTWQVSGTYQEAYDTYHFQVTNGTNVWAHNVDGRDVSSACFSGSGIAMGYTAPESPTIGDIFFDPAQMETYVFVGDNWVTLSEGQSAEWNSRDS